MQGFFKGVPPDGFEPPFLVPKTNVLSVELWGLYYYIYKLVWHENDFLGNFSVNAYFYPLSF